MQDGIKFTKRKWRTVVIKKSEIIDIMESVNAIIWEYNIKADRWDYVSPQTKTMLGYEPEEWTGLDFLANNIHEEDQSWAVDYCLECTKEGKSHIFEYRFKKKDGNYLWLRDEVVVIMEDGEPVKLRGFMTDITDLKGRENRIEDLSFQDRLTNLYNRRFLEEELLRLNTERQLPLSIIMADVNGLKIINDTFGHEVGDEMLINTARLLEKSMRKEDILARHGGDEFAMLLPKTGKNQAEKILSRLRSEAGEIRMKEIPISLSFGMATKTEKTEDIEVILKKADDAMYQHKLLEGKSAKNKIIQSILGTLNVRSGETKEHALRMTALARDLGKKLSLSSSELDRLSLLSVLHDIGKILIPQEILCKPGKLTEKEWAMIKKHPETGSRIAASTKEFELVAKEIRSHHEHWDGRGYPHGLSHEDIPYLARIITIIDAYDVMTHERSYSKALSKKEALKEIKRCSGTQFDPAIAESFTEMLEH